MSELPLQKLGKVTITVATNTYRVRVVGISKQYDIPLEVNITSKYSLEDAMNGASTRANKYLKEVVAQ